MTKQQWKTYRDRWALVNQAEIEELRRTPVDVKFRQLLALTQFAGVLDTMPQRRRLEDTVRQVEEDQARRRWMRFRELWRESHH